MRCASDALTTATVETGRGQHRGAKAAPIRNASSKAPSRCAARPSGFFMPSRSVPKHLNKSRVEQRTRERAVAVEKGGSGEVTSEICWNKRARDKEARQVVST